MSMQKISVWDKHNHKQYSLEYDTQDGDYIEYDINGVPFVANWKAPTDQPNTTDGDNEYGEWLRQNGFGIDGSPNSIY